MNALMKRKYIFQYKTVNFVKTHFGDIYLQLEVIAVISSVR